MLYFAYSKLCRAKLFERKRKPHTIFEKRHKIIKFANYQNKIERKRRTGYLEDKQWDLINFGREKKRYTKNNRKKIGIESPHLPY